jgi:hypothetical protein
VADVQPAIILAEDDIKHPVALVLDVPVLADRLGQRAHVVGDDAAAGLQAGVALVEGDVLLQKTALDIAHGAVEQGLYGLRERGLVVLGRQDEIGPAHPPRNRFIVRDR